MDWKVLCFPPSLRLSFRSQPHCSSRVPACHLIILPCRPENPVNWVGFLIQNLAAKKGEQDNIRSSMFPNRLVKYCLMQNKCPTNESMWLQTTPSYPPDNESYTHQIERIQMEEIIWKYIAVLFQKIHKLQCSQNTSGNNWICWKTDEILFLVSHCWSQYGNTLVGHID